jgi:hypothetical protein
MFHIVNVQHVDGHASGKGDHVTSEELSVRERRYEMKTVLSAVTGLTLLVMEVSTTAVAGQMNVSDHFTCSGRIAKLGTQGADRSIGGGDSMCYFPSKSAIGRQILAACPLESECEIIGRVENDRSAEDWSPIITRVYKVRRR